MPKKTKTTEAVIPEEIQSESDDVIIATGLASIREGILTNSIELIVKGYNYISGENLTIPVKTKSKLERIRENLLNITDNSKINDIDTDDEIADVNEDQNPGIITEKQGKMTVISTEYDPILAKKNAKIAKTKLNLDPIPRAKPPEDSSSTDKSVRFYNRNSPPSKPNG